MGKYRRTAIGAVVFLLIAGSIAAYWLSVQPSRTEDEDAISVTRMDRLVQSFVSDKGFMGSVLVARGNEILLNRGYGFANLASGTPNTPSTKFRLGSITKQFTAACILLLEERKKLRLDDPVKKYLPSAPPAWDKVTIFNLLTHTSGIPDFTTFPDYEAAKGNPTTPESLIARFRDKPLEFEPGKRWSYSNSAYVVLGYIIEKITGQSYAQFVRENIFLPLGMKNSGYEASSASVNNRANGYALVKNRLIPAEYINMSVPFSAGGLYSTTEDLRLWERGLFGGKILSDRSLKKMTTPFRDNYALGLYVFARNGYRVVQHPGGIEGFAAELAYYPQDGLIVAVLSNVAGNAVPAIAANLASLVHGEQVLMFPDPTMASEPTIGSSPIPALQPAPTLHLPGSH